ncbi:hypothetical protein FQN52_002513 [Onygenales sp. PD_12]|nr:hypothetical protein FQN52_002513 [Onygenales sp. PD_12]
MDTVPQELFLLILRHLIDSESHDRQLETGGWNHLRPAMILEAKKSPVPPAHTEYVKRIIDYITVSRRWQHALEHLFFSEMVTDNNQIPKLAQLFRPSQSHRKALVKSFRVNVVNPADEGEGEGESQEARIYRLFDEAIRVIFRALEALDQMADSASTCSSSSPGVHLRIVSILKPAPDLVRSVGIYALPIGRTTTPLLPKISSITGFACDHGASSFSVSHLAGLGMASRLDNLRVLSMCCSEDKGYDITERRKARQDYADAILSLPHSLQDATLIWDPNRVMDESQYPPSILPDDSESPIDPLNAALHDLCQRENFKKLDLKSHLVSPELFWPSSSSKPAPSMTGPDQPAAPSWPSLESIAVSIMPTTPDGKWYFTSDPGVASYDSFVGAIGSNKSGPNQRMPLTYNAFRSMPDPVTMNPFLIAMARAARCAPLLEMMKVEINDFLIPVYIQSPPDWFQRLFRVVYSSKVGELRVEVKVDGWRMEEEVEREWRETMGPEGKIVYVYSGMEGERTMFAS